MDYAGFFFLLLLLFFPGLCKLSEPKLCFLCKSTDLISVYKAGRVSLLYKITLQVYVLWLQKPLGDPAAVLRS